MYLKRFIWGVWHTRPTLLALTAKPLSVDPQRDDEQYLQEAAAHRFHHIHY